MIRGPGGWIEELAAQRIPRFIAFGIINTAFGYGVYALLILAGLAPQPALVLSFAAGIAWNYFTTARFVFGQRSFRGFPRYLLSYGVVYGANAGGLHIVLGLGLPPLIAQAVLLPPVAARAYVLMFYALIGRVTYRE